MKALSKPMTFGQRGLHDWGVLMIIIPLATLQQGCKNEAASSTLNAELESCRHVPDSELDQSLISLLGEGGGEFAGNQFVWDPTGEGKHHDDVDIQQEDGKASFYMVQPNHSQNPTHTATEDVLAERSSLSLVAATTNLRADLIIGQDILDEIADYAAQEAVHGRQQQSISISKLERDLQSVISNFTPMLQPFDTVATIRVVYSFCQTKRTIKTRFVDPKIAALQGFGSRIVKRRYFNCRGLVYRKVNQTLDRILMQYHQLAKTHLARVSSANIKLDLQFAEHCGIIPRRFSTVDLYLNNEKQSSTYYYELKEALNKVEPLLAASPLRPSW